MSKNRVNLINYEEVLTELEHSKPNNHLLLGNGFNLSLGIGTDYKSIFNKMKENNQEYESVIIDNFDLEGFIGICKKMIKEKDNPYSNFMKKYYHNKIKLDFMKAVTQIVTKEIKSIYQEKNDKIYLLLKQFDTYFTLNYDPFLYQLMMSYVKDDKAEAIVFENTLPFIKEQMEENTLEILKEIENGYNNGILTINMGNDKKQLELNKLNKATFETDMKQYFGSKVTPKDLKMAIDHFWKNKDTTRVKVIEKIDDGFGLFNGKLTYQNPKTQNLYFLHGAFHLYQKGKTVHKITQQSERALYQRIEEIVEDVEEKIICIFSDTNKEEEIVSNEYLKNGLNKLSELKGSLMILGSSIASNDSHIFNKINESKIGKIYIASCEKNRENDLEKARTYFPKKELLLFDRDTISYM